MARRARVKPKGSLRAFYLAVTDHGPKPSSKGTRITYIVGLMAGNLWVTGVTLHELHKQWGVGIDVLKREAAEASRTLAADPIDLAAARARWRANIESAKAMATKMGKPQALGTILKVEASYLSKLESPDDLPLPAPIEVDRSVTINFVPTTAPAPEPAP